MGATYIYRMDDINPKMDWGQFWKFINLFKTYNVKPLLGVAPNNKDKDLMVDEENKDFWEIIRNLKEEGIIDIAQHGYQHRLFCSHANDSFGLKISSANLTEFAGLPYKEQYKRIKKGQMIMRENGIYTDIWMAPCHSFDLVTLRVLKDLGFHFITDGMAAYPFLINDMVFVPQQLWQPRWFPFGIFTICIHANNSDENAFEKIKKHLESANQIIGFDNVSKPIIYKTHRILNCFFVIGYVTAANIRMFLKKILQWHKHK